LTKQYAERVEEVKKSKGSQSRTVKTSRAILATDALVEILIPKS